MLFLLLSLKWHTVCSSRRLAQLLWCWSMVGLRTAFRKLTEISVRACVVAFFVTVTLEEAEEDEAEDDGNGQQDA